MNGEMKRTIPQSRRGAVPSIFSSYIGEVSMIVDSHIKNVKNWYIHLYNLNVLTKNILIIQLKI